MYADGFIITAAVMVAHIPALIDAKGTVSRRVPGTPRFTHSTSLPVLARILIWLC
jgi:hypothetical protein